MGKASSAKKVARAATTGGGRTSQGARPWGWYAVMAAVAAVGVVLIVTSRNERLSADNPAKAEKPRPPSSDGKFEGDHWHAAYGVFICDDFLPDIQSDRDPNGIHTHNDGVIHIHPFTSASSGSRATLGAFVQTVGMTLTDDELKVPGGKSYGKDSKCGDKPGKVRVLLNGEERSGDPKDIRLRDRDKLVIAFAPADAKLPEDPPSLGNLDRLTDVEGSPGATSSTTQAPNPEGVPTSAPPAAGAPPPTSPAPPTPSPQTGTP